MSSQYKVKFIAWLPVGFWKCQNLHWCEGHNVRVTNKQVINLYRHEHQLVQMRYLKSSNGNSIFLFPCEIQIYYLDIWQLWDLKLNDILLFFRIILSFKIVFMKL